MMDKRSLGIYLIMKNLREFTIETFDDRLILQKSIYLLQLLGVDLRFRFGWYHRGPYSRDLTEIAYEINSHKDDYSNFAERMKLRGDVLEKISRLKKIIQNKPQSLEEPRWFELLSSIHFLKHVSTTNPDEITKDKIENKLIEAGKQDFDSQHILEAWKRLEDIDLIARKSHEAIAIQG